MELASYQLQMFVSLLVVLAAACVALICDFLKGNNEQLRELTVELQIRREEERRRFQAVTARAMRAPSIEPALTSNPISSDHTLSEHIVESPREIAPQAAPRSVSVPASPARDASRKRPISPDVLAVFARGEQLAASPRGKMKSAPGSLPEIKCPTDEEVLAAITPDVPPANPDIETTESLFPISPDLPLAVASASEDVTLVAAPSADVAKKDWGSLLGRKPELAYSAALGVVKHTVEVREDLLDAVVAATASSRSQSGDAVPAGFHDGYVLSRLVQSRKPVSGLVVSIGVNTSRNSDGSIPEAVRQLIESLIGPGDFACQSGREEFLLIFPRERGASAQRRVSGIAQRLWDFQLRSISKNTAGTCSILFSWGSVEVRSESIDEAIASANERMQQTRRGRKLLTMEPRGEALKQAV